MWASSTPIRTSANANVFDPRTDRIRTRNQIALDYVSAQKDIKVDDLFATVIDHPEYYQGGDGTHPLQIGFSALAQKVAAELSALLEDK